MSKVPQTGVRCSGNERNPEREWESPPGRTQHWQKPRRHQKMKKIGGGSNDRQLRGLKANNSEQRRQQQQQQQRSADSSSSGQQQQQTDSRGGAESASPSGACRRRRGKDRRRDAMGGTEGGEGSPEMERNHLTERRGAARRIGRGIGEG